MVKPAYFTHPDYTVSLGPEVCDLATLAGLPPDPEQALGLDAMFALDLDRRTLKGNVATAAFAFAIVCARQNMKTGMLKMAALGWLYITDQELVVWSAHEMDTTREAFGDMINLIEDTPSLSRRLAPGPTNGIFRGTGTEMIELAPGEYCRHGNKVNNPCEKCVGPARPACPHGQRLKFKARTSGGGRGLTGNKVVLDEAMYLEKSHMGALLPTLSAVDDPQIIYGGSAGLAKSEVWRGVRDRGRKGGEVEGGDVKGAPKGRLAYMEFCSQPEENACAEETCSHALEVEGCALDDVEYLRQSNPALERRITIDYIRAERDELPPDEYGRERAGWWDKPEGITEPLITPDMWRDLEDRTDANVPVDPVSFGVYVNNERTKSAIGFMARRPDGLYICGIVPAVRGQRIDMLPGTLWIAGRLKQLCEAWRPHALVVQGGSGAASLINEIEAQTGMEVTKSNSTDLVLACGNFYDAVKPDDQGVTHMRHRGATPLFRAVTGAKKRELTATDNWVWDRKDKDADITQLMAVTLAMHGIDPNPYDVLESVW
jgi:hypothetical protein